MLTTTTSLSFPILKMTKIAELKDKGAVVAWSPIGGEGENNYADVIALGSKVRACAVTSIALSSLFLSSLCQNQNGVYCRRASASSCVCVCGGGEGENTLSLVV